ncbi:hypothetical protein DH2020_035253 [Rehmannia glutinosa]|uniref:Transcription initiation factor IIF subunit beta n=1 Tax=Rehmannia glutinosa TaxID=99300 RepID=A0ABR0V6Z9_REHGL
MEDDYSNDNTTVDTAKADRSVWLMKCPPIVANAWQSSSASAVDDSPPVAKVVVSLDLLQPEDPPSLQVNFLLSLFGFVLLLLYFTMEMAGSEVVNMPKSYSLNMFKDFVPMGVFSETNQGRVAMEGKVEHKFDMKPHHRNIEEYRKMCRERTNKSMVKNRQIQVINNDRGVHMRPMPGMMGLITSTSKAITFLLLFYVIQDKKKAAPVKASDMKRTRRDRGELEDIMFKLFERQPNWTLKQLVQETDQPAQFLKEILNELCVYNKRGTNQGTYELKAEYKKSVEDTGAE